MSTDIIDHFLYPTETGDSVGKYEDDPYSADDRTIEIIRNRNNELWELIENYVGDPENLILVNVSNYLTQEERVPEEWAKKLVELAFAHPDPSDPSWSTSLINNEIVDFWRWTILTTKIAREVLSSLSADELQKLYEESLT